MECGGQGHRWRGRRGGQALALARSLDEAARRALVCSLCMAPAGPCAICEMGRWRATLHGLLTRPQIIPAPHEDRCDQSGNGGRAS
jgi:hypothetical protein